MRVSVKQLTATFICFFFLFGAIGCAWLKPETPGESTPRPQLSEEGNSRYYYYTIALLEKKAGNSDKAAAYLNRAIQLDPEALELKKELAQTYLQQGNGEAALPLTQEILEKNPDHVEALIMHGSILQHQKKHAEAEDVFEKVIRLEPNRQAVFLNLGAMYQEEKKYSQALAVYKKLIEYHPDAYFGYFSIGKVYEQQGDLENAVAFYLKTIEIDPRLLEPRYQVKKIYEKDVFPPLTEKEFEKVSISRKTTLRQFANKRYGDTAALAEETIVALNPTVSASPTLSPGTRLTVPGATVLTRYPKAIDRMNRILELYREILEMHPQNDRAAVELGLFYRKLGLKEEAGRYFAVVATDIDADRSIIDSIYFLYFEQKRYEDAVYIIDGILAHKPDHSDLNYLSGAAYEKLNKSDEAIARFLKVKTDSRFYENAIVNAAFLYQSQKNPDKAAALIEDAIRNVPDNEQFYLYLGAIHEETGDYEKAVIVLRKGLELDKDHTGILFRLGVVYDKWGQKDLSISQMKHVIQINPKDPHALNYLGYTYLDLDRNLDKAEELIREANRLAPEDGYIMDSLGWLYYKNNDYEKAVELLEKAVGLVPDDPIILEHLGDAYQKTDSPEKALEFYRRALMQKKKDASELERKIHALSP